MKIIFKAHRLKANEMIPRLPQKKFAEREVYSVDVDFKMQICTGVSKNISTRKKNSDFSKPMTSNSTRQLWKNTIWSRRDFLTVRKKRIELPSNFNIHRTVSMWLMRLKAFFFYLFEPGSRALVLLTQQSGMFVQLTCFNNTCSTDRFCMKIQKQPTISCR